MDKHSVDYSANHIVNTVTGTGTKYVNTTTYTDGKDHPDYGVLYDEQHLYGNPLNYISNEGIVITSDAVFIKPLNLVIMTEDNYKKLRGEENEAD